MHLFFQQNLYILKKAMAFHTFHDYKVFNILFYTS
jgi:hypothetical protein